MRLCDFFKKISGDFTVKIYKNNDVVIREGMLTELKDEEQKSFDILDGFDNELWEKSVQDFVIKDKIIAILVEVEEETTEE